MIPWLVFAVVIVPLVVVAFVVSRRNSARNRYELDAKTQDEFAAAEAFEADWHEADEERFRKERLP